MTLYNNLSRSPITRNETPITKHGTLNAATERFLKMASFGALGRLTLGLTTESLLEKTCLKTVASFMSVCGVSPSSNLSLKESPKPKL